VTTSRLVELQAVLEGVPLPATKQELTEYARAQSGGGELLALLEALPDREYRSLDDVGEALNPVQPAFERDEPQLPRPESGVPPGGEAYTDASAEPGRVRERGPE
jgi:hypothetical protein